ncbi:electron transport complex, RnfABCDGE type, C subunit [Candidatus Ruthia magnifica str. Cm (Calyptogena magnifica)]|uniref:Ion-translocating oxidoreductase complex subunit C n=1 Tax=Ruthia magnifica subsp. Calyptogena magnifica TaxID=413404 RepID=A1AVH8_RUTMC|nr:electron transport complex subunit RsxC [Candidatus Ruthturnera calyptogenae]ABL01935.1 electron transport complex, RnfABCDGE type, C subunit [Candidatus Ruthia magnifica str. Cm (Calyptogena magnifica)]
MDDYSFNGGIVIRNPYPVDKMEIIQAPLPKKVIISLQQCIGEHAKPCVSVGDYVLTGQVIASAEGSFGVFIHASISGVVLSIDKQVISHKSGVKFECITIESDDKDKWIDNEGCGVDFLHSPVQTMIDCIQKSGIVGLGGAGFPTHVKLGKIKQCHTLIINGTECEPGVMCDNALMQFYPREIIRGVEILLYICGAERAIIAIEDDKQVAYQALLMFNHNDRISINQISTKYTSGAEKLLIKALLGVEISTGGFAVDKGIVCQNVATTKAVFDAVVDHKPLVSRIVTVTGSGVKPNNFEVRLGASFESLISIASPSQKAHDYRMGGMMMGVDVTDIQAPICKITNAIFVSNHIQKPAIQECIRCGKCSEVCPVKLLPQQLYWHTKSENIEKALNYNLADCIECACCDYVCPSHISLANYFSFAKTLNKQQTREQDRINIARERFEFREYRLERNKLERAQMMVDKKKALKEKMVKDQSQKQKIAEAVQRVQQTKNKK